jgi:aryl sulfotransferase
VTASLVWLASYPRSGSTWLRAILSGYRADAAPDLDRLDAGWIISRRDLDAVAGFDTMALPWEPTLSLVPVAVRAAVARRTGVVWAKTHAAPVETAAGPLHPGDITHGAVYVVRDPRDAVVSYSHHASVDVATAVERFADPDHALVREPEAWTAQPPEPLGRWSDHVVAWRSAQPAPLVVRYEDLHQDPLTEAAGVLSHAGIAVDPARLERAVEHASFTGLAERERRDGFREGPGPEPFFRQGEVGQWRDVLSDDDARRIVDVHGDVMHTLGYAT